MEWNLPFFLLLLLFRGTLVLSKWQQALGKKLFSATTGLYVKQRIVCLLDMRVSEATQAKLHESAVVQDLGGQVRVLNSIL